MQALDLAAAAGFAMRASKGDFMSAHCCAPSAPAARSVDPRFRAALWIALAVNAAMFAVEIAAAARSGSVSLLADAIDFFGDAANYALSLAVIALPLAVRARAALFKAACMGGFGVFVLARAAWALQAGTAPQPLTMGAVALAALVANAGVAVLLYAFRTGDANMRSVWICSRNDALGNLAVGLAALGVFGTGSAWPDLAVAALMALLAITGAWTVLRQAWRSTVHAPSCGMRERGRAGTQPSMSRAAGILKFSRRVAITVSARKHSSAHRKHTTPSRKPPIAHTLTRNDAVSPRNSTMMVSPIRKAQVVSSAMQPLASRPRMRSCASSAEARARNAASRDSSARSSSCRPRSMMRASRPATAPIIPDTAVSRNTGATASWMPWVMLSLSSGQIMAGDYRP
jgi:Co/Zn/Cd efflux system component